MRIACTHPGKMGDALYALPTIRQIAKETGTKIDFYTSEYCAPLKYLFEYQRCINKFFISPGYIIERMDMGIQPWKMPVYDGYDVIYHLGFRRVPDQAIHQFIWKEAFGYDTPLAIEYDYPDIPIIDWNGAPAITFRNKLGHDPRIHVPFVCLASRSPSSYDQFFYDLSLALRQRDMPVVQIGAEGQYVGVGRDATGENMLDTLSLLAHSRGFVGLMSSQLVLANGFDIPRIAIHDGIHWDMSHVIKYHRNYYPVNPTVEQVLQLLEIGT